MNYTKDVEKAKATYLSGMRVHLLKMDDAQAPRAGTEGTVRGVDAMGNIMIRWDNGSGLSVIPGVDEIEIIRRDEE